MELENHTRFPAFLYRGGIDETRLFGAVFARVTYDIVDGKLTPAEEQIWPVSPGPWESDYGPMDSDEVFYRGGIDILVFGSARPPLGRPATWVEVTVEVGDSFRRRLLVIGDRYWVRSGQNLVPSEPAPFTEMPLDLAHAFGGEDEWDELKVAFPDNPEGKGYSMSEESAESRPLPNIEDPDERIVRWDDRPEPVGIAATTMAFGPRARRSAEWDEETGALKELKPEFFNSAFPGMVVPDVASGDLVRISGMRKEGPLEFRLPPPGLRTRLRFGEETVEQDLYIDQVGIEVDHQRAFVAWRYPFRYELIPLQKRSCELLDIGRDPGG